MSNIKLKILSYEANMILNLLEKFEQAKTDFVYFLQFFRFGQIFDRPFIWAKLI